MDRPVVPEDQDRTPDRSPEATQELYRTPASHGPLSVGSGTFRPASNRRCTNIAPSGRGVGASEGSLGEPALFPPVRLEEAVLVTHRQGIGWSGLVAATFIRAKSCEEDHAFSGEFGVTRNECGSERRAWGLERIPGGWMPPSGTVRGTWPLSRGIRAPN